MKKTLTLMLLLCSVAVSAQIYVYNGYSLISEFEQTPDSIITIAPYRTPMPASDQGALPGVFSVSPNRKVRFSKGNLQYSVESGLWRFAESQFDTLGGNIDKSIIDQFGHGTSGWEGSKAQAYLPTDTITQNEAYAGYVGQDPDYSLTGYMAQRDWGIHNPITNGGNKPGLWRTLTYNEWHHMLINRWTPYAVAIVNGIWGIVVLPDEWNEAPTLKLRPCYYDKNWKDSSPLTSEEIAQILELCHNDTIAASHDYNNPALSTLGIKLDIAFYSFTPGYDDQGNYLPDTPIEDYSITPAEWRTLEAKGCVFLPFNKSRNHPQNQERTTSGNLRQYFYCFYWSAGECAPSMEYRYDQGSSRPYHFNLMVNCNSAGYLFCGGLVRLVQDY